MVDEIDKVSVFLGNISGRASLLELGGVGIPP
jgi:hypothetical protein